MRFSRFTLLTACMCFGTGIPVGHAAEINELNTVVVSATRTAQSTLSTPSSISVITRDDIEASGAANLIDVLRNQGGVQISDFYGDGRSTLVSIRGFGANAGANTLVLIDGRRLNNPDLATPSLNTIPLDDIERVEIVQGSAGTLFGDQAVGGVINIITREPQKLRVRVRGSVGTHDSQDGFVSASQRFANGIFYRLSAQDRQSDNYRDNNEFDQQNILARIGLDHHSGRIFLEHQAFNEDANFPGGLFPDEFRVDRRQAQYPNDFSNRDTRASRLVVQQTLSDAWQLEAEITNRKTDIDGVLTNTVFSQRRNVKEFTPRFIGSFPNKYGELLVTVGADFNTSDYKLVSQFSFGPANTRNHQEQQAAYFQIVAPLSRTITLTTGGRTARVNNNLVDTFSFPAGTNINDRASAVELGLAWRPVKNWRLYGRWDENFRFAKVDEYTFTATSEPIRTQTGDSYEFGAEYTAGKYSAKALVYQLKLDNEIDFDPTVAFGGNRNLDGTTRNGLILEGSTSMFRDLTLTAQYSYVDAEFDKGSNKGKRIPLVARNTAHLSALYQINPAFSLFAEMQYIDDRVAGGDYRNSFPGLDGYTIVNLNARYQYKKLLAALRINNLTNRKYSDYAAVGFNPAKSFAQETAFYAAPERTIALTLEYQFDGP